MGLSEADTKILWARAAGLCSMPDCREILVCFRKADDGMYQIGEMAHIVARSIKGPRGDGPLSLVSRDTYENHTLLCPKCHTVVDKNPTDYPVEKLQEFKRQHEGWVAEILLENLHRKISFLSFYTNILRQLEAFLQLDKWAWVIEHLWRDLAPMDLIVSIGAPRSLLLKTIWPGNRPGLERAFKEVLETWSAYCENFSEGCGPSRNANFLRSAHINSEMSGPERQAAAAEQDKWAHRNGDLLYEYAKALNRMVDAVRLDLLPTYRQDEGYFLIYDTFGYRTGGDGMIIKPICEPEKENN